jgi:DNA repair protein RadA/Sms
MAAKTKNVFFCSNCGFESPKWLGKCPSCGEWNTFVEEPVVKKSGKIAAETRRSQPLPVSEIKSDETSRLDTKSIELNRVLGGGLVPGAVTLIGGEPGIGKSTLMLQFALRVPSFKILYVSGEESEQQIKLRSDRIGGNNPHCLVVSETSVEAILGHCKSVNPDIVIIDSIQTLETEAIEASPGSVSQVRECTARLLRYAKENQKPVFLVGHITKEGSLAGPKVLEHMVDTVLQFEGDSHHQYRILRAIKNRFGSTSEIGIFEMRQTGLKEIPNPSDILLSHSEVPYSGTAVTSTLEGNRPILVEVQALVSGAAYGTPQRTANGFDQRRLNMILAVLEKRAGFRLSTKDVFINFAGGLKVSDPAADIAVTAAILSSDLDKPVHTKLCMAGELGLTGEIRPVSRIEQRIADAEKLGFDTIIIPAFNKKGTVFDKFKIRIIPVSNLKDFVKHLFA